MRKLKLWINKILAKRIVKRRVKKRITAINSLTSNEKKLFQLFKVVLKTHKYIIKFDNNRTVNNENINILIRDSVISEDMKITVKINGGNYLDMYLCFEKAEIFKEEFDKYARRNSTKYETLNSKEIEEFLDGALNSEKQTNDNEK